MRERIKQIRKDSKMTQQSFAEFLGVSKSNVESYELGRRIPSDSFISLLESKLNVNREWLETGEGNAYVPVTENQQIAAFINRVMADKPESFRKRFILALSNLSDDGWKMLGEFLDNLLEI